MWPTTSIDNVCDTAFRQKGWIYLLRCQDTGIAIDAYYYINNLWINLTGRGSTSVSINDFVDTISNWTIKDPSPGRDLFVLKDPGLEASPPTMSSRWASLNVLRDRIHAFLLESDASLVILLTELSFDSLQAQLKDLLSISVVDSIGEEPPGCEGPDDLSGEPARALISSLESKYSLSTDRFIQRTINGDTDSIESNDLKRWMSAAVFLRREE
jgi:hypothetical protein